MKKFLNSDWLRECNFIEIQCQKRNTDNTKKEILHAQCQKQKTC